MRRLGLLIPSSNTTMETELRRALGGSFSLHVARLGLRSVNVRELGEMEEELEEEARKLADAGVEIIAYGCTTGSLVKGLGHEKRIREKIEAATGIAAVATAGSVVEALRSLGLTRIAVATPYIDDLNRLEKSFLEGNGFAVVDLKGLGIELNLEIGRVDGEKVKALVRSLSLERAQGIFISCTNLPTLSAIDELEAESGKPIVSSNTATLWSIGRKCGGSFEFARLGQLFR